MLDVQKGGEMKNASPIAILSIIAGIIIFLVPNILSYVLALYLIVSGALMLTKK
jgi:hypothetical protein